MRQEEEYGKILKPRGHLTLKPTRPKLQLSLQMLRTSPRLGETLQHVQMVILFLI